MMIKKLYVTFPFDKNIPGEYRGRGINVKFCGIPDSALLWDYYISEIINPNPPHNLIPVNYDSDIAHQLPYARIDGLNMGSDDFLRLTNEAMVEAAKRTFFPEASEPPKPADSTRA
ncbi:MAG: hypothetical protein V1648_05260 [Candidatus Aenigmatarchaeota archaeon]